MKRLKTEHRRQKPESELNAMSQNLTITIIMSTCACVLGWAVWVIAVNIRRSQANKRVAEIHSRLLDRFADSRELIAFLEGTAGRRYFEALEFDTRGSLTRILNAIQVGVVLLLLGISFLAIRASQDESDIRNALLLVGVPCAGLGAGFLISAAISHRICKAWGVLDQNERSVS